MHKFLFLFLLPLSLLAQNSLDATINLQQGSSFNLTKKSNIEGTPYLFEDWQSGNIIQNDTNYIPKAKLQFNAYSNEIIIGDSRFSDKGFYVTDKSVTGFVIKNDVFFTTYQKINGSQFLSPKSKNLYYETITDVKNKKPYLIIEHQKVIFDPSISNSAAIDTNEASEYKLKKQYYILNKDNKYVKINLSKRSVFKIFKDKNSEMKSYLKKHSFKFKNKEKLNEFVIYYHSLQSN